MKLIGIAVLMISMVGIIIAQEQSPAKPDVKPEITEKAEIPTLTEVQKLKLENSIQRIAILQMKLEAEQKEFSELIQSYRIKGYTLDLNTFTYLPEIPKKEK